MNIKSVIISVLVLIMFAGAAYAVSNYGRNASIEGLGAGSGAVVYVVDATGLLGQDVANLAYYPANQTLVVKLIKVQNISDSDNPAYYIDPANTGTSALFAGNVGIGLTPTAKLEVVGGIHALGSEIWSTSNASPAQGDIIAIGHDGTIAYVGATYHTGGYTPLVFLTNGSEKVRIATSGNVGIGTTTFPSGGGTPGMYYGNAVNNPTGMPANVAGWFNKAGEMYGIDSSSTVTGPLTPHPDEFLVALPNDANHMFPWVFSEENPYLGKKLTVDMELLVRLVEKANPGEKIIYEEELPKASWVALEAWRESQENLKNKNSAVDAWLRNASEIEVLSSQAFEFVNDDKTITTGRVVGTTTEYSLDEVNETITAIQVPIYETKVISKQKKQLKEGIRFDKSIGKFYRKPTKAEAEAAVGENYLHYLKQSPPQWMAVRGVN